MRDVRRSPQSAGHRPESSSGQHLDVRANRVGPAGLGSARGSASLLHRGWRRLFDSVHCMMAWVRYAGSSLARDHAASRFPAKE